MKIKDQMVGIQMLGGQTELWDEVTRSILKRR
jgi:hypothetical protein